MKKTLLTSCALALILTQALRAETFDFNALTDADIKLGPSKNADGSAAVLSPDRPKSGTQSLKCVYNIGPNNGYAEFVFNAGLKGPQLLEARKYKVSFWVRGNEEVKASPVGLRFIDAKREVHQYMLPSIESHLKNPEWSKYETVIDLTNSTAHWGTGSKDALVAVPATLFSIALNGGTAGDSGSLYFDDLTFEPVQ